jgi:hypothetical protein
MRSLPLRLTLPFEGELLCRYINFGKKIPFVKCDGADTANIVAMNFPEFDN